MINRPNIAAWVVASLLLSGCAYSPQPEVASLGDNQYLVECGGIFLDFKDCRKKAQMLCPAGYHVLDVKNSNDTHHLYDNKGMPNGSIVGGQIRSLRIQCQ